MKVITFFILIITLTSACATHFGSINPTSTHNNVIYTDIAIGVAQTTTFCGLGSTTKDALILEAKRKLILNRPLKVNEEYANFTLDFKKTLLGTFIKTKVTMTADVITHITNTPTEMYTDLYKSKLYGKIPTNNLFNIGDSIVYRIGHNIRNSKAKTGAIISFENNDVVRIAYCTKNGNIRTKNKSISNIYSIKKSYNNYNCGDQDTIVDKEMSSIKYKGIIYAVGTDAFYLLEDSFYLKRFKYENYTLRTNKKTNE